MPLLQSFDLRINVFPNKSIKHGLLWDTFRFPLCWLTSLIRYLQFLELCSLCGIWVMAPSLGPAGKMTKDARCDCNISSTSSAFFPLVVKILD